MKKEKFETLYVECNQNTNNIFDLDGDHYSPFHEDYILGTQFIIYGLPKELSEDQVEDFYEGDKSNLIQIGKISGYLILSEEILNQGEDPLMLCDDISGDLQFAISVLQDDHGPLNEFLGNLYQNVYYIDKFEMENIYKSDDNLKSKIISLFPDVIFSLLHVGPGILAYIPMRTHDEEAKKPDERATALHHIVSQKINAIPFFKEDESTGEDANNNVIDFGKNYKLSEEEIDMVIGRRVDESAYPEEYKNIDEFNFYEANGFEEIGDSRLLYKEV